MNISKLVVFSGKFLYLDNDFPRRVFKASMVLSVVLTVFSVAFWSLEITCGLFVGMVISIGLMRLLWWMISVVFPVIVKADIKNKEKKVKLSLICFSLVKYCLISAGLFYVLRYVHVNLIAFFIGISFVQLVMVSKILSILLVNYLNKSITVDGDKTRKHDFN
ncbi:MAG: ATP synthase subunit I [Candidatus Anammoxibacter sp.]